jgi:hypothetical protein
MVPAKVFGSPFSFGISPGGIGAMIRHTDAEPLYEVAAGGRAMLIGLTLRWLWSLKASFSLVSN